jgi:ATP-dependent Clp protease ATP-binding subunit ClpC
VLLLAQAESERLQQEYIGTEHLLLGLLREGSGVACYVLKALAVDFDKIRSQIEVLSASGPALFGMVPKRPRTPAVKRVIDRAWSESQDMRHPFVGTEHLLLGLMLEANCVAAQLLMNAGLRLDLVRDQLLRVLGPPASLPRPKLKRYR